MVIPRPSKDVKFQFPGLFLVVEGLKFQSLGGFRYTCCGFMVRPWVWYAQLRDWWMPNALILKGNQ